MTDHGTTAWRELLALCPDEVAAHVAERLEQPGRLVLDPVQLATEVHADEAEIERCLGHLAEADHLEVTTGRLHRPCGLGLQPTDEERCPNCERPLVDDDIEQRRWYARPAPRRRDVPWAIVVHGMNTRGPWQEELSWRVATSYRRSVPVYAFKYGRVEIGVLLRWRQRQLAQRLAATIRRLSGEPDDSRLGHRPDVICHSFGTWLVGHALARHPDVEVGRVILVASILPPTFEWATLRERGQVEAVLNHRAERDRIVGLATYVVPDAGPSGTRGFDPGVPAVDRVEPGFGHSEFFDTVRLPAMFVDVWQPFLRAPDEELTEGREGASWRPPPWPVRATVPRALGLLAVLAVVALAVVLPGLAICKLL